MKITDVWTAQPVPNPHGVAVSRLYDTSNAQAMHITLQPGERLRRHITPVDVFFYVLEGRGVVEIGEQEAQVGPDSLIDSPARIPHCWRNDGDKTLRILVVKVPRPTESPRLL